VPETKGVYHGWRIALALGVTETTSWGIVYYAFSVILTPMQAELGFSRGQITLAFSLAILASGLAAVPVGAWIDRHGGRAVMTVGSVLAVGLTAAWAAVDTLVVLYAVWALMGVTWAMVLYEPAFAVLTQWFRRYRGRALTVVTGFAAFASTIFFPLTTWLVELQGWRGALLTLAVILAVMTIPLHALVLRRRPEDLGLIVDGQPDDGRQPPVADVTARAAVRGPTFWWLALTFALESVVLVGLSVHLIPYLVDVGHGAGFAAAAAGLVGAMKFPARVILGPLADRLPVFVLTGGLFAACAVAIGILAAAPTVVGALTFAAIYGSASGALTTARPLLVAALYGRAAYGTISGAMSATGVAARAAAPVGIGFLYDGLGTYGPVIWGLVAVSLVALLGLVAATTSTATRRLPVGAAGRG
jgi:MFS family permease